MKKALPFLLALPFIPLAGKLCGQDSLTQHNMRELVVTGQYAPTDLRNAILPVRILKRDQIERMGANNLEQLLKQELNLRIGQDMILGSSLSIQGLSGRNVKILQDGVPMIGRTDGNLDLGQINLANIDRIEIIEGPASVFYGTDALAGVINLISKKRQKDTWNLGVSAQYEQLGERSLTANSGVKIGEKCLLLAAAGYDRFEGFDTSATARNLLWNPKDQYYADASLRYAFTRSNNILRLKAAFFKETVENQGDIRRPQFKPYAFDDTYHTLRRDIALLHEGPVFKTLFWNNTIGFNSFRRQKESLRTEIETGAQNPIAGEQDTSRFNSYTLRSVLASKKSDQRWQWLAGIDARHDAGFGQRIRDTLSEKAGQSALTDAAFIGSLRFLPGSRTVLETGLRAGWNSRYDGVIVPSLNLKQRLLKKVDVRANFAQGFRSPDLKELYFYFVDASHYVIGNPDLRPEKSNNVQLNLAFDNPDLNEGQSDSKNKTLPFGIRLSNAQLSTFWNEITDKIELFEFVETDQGIEPVQGDSATFRYAYFNIEKFKTHGATLRATLARGSFQLSGGLNVTGFYNPYHREFSATPRFTYTHEINAALQWLHKSWNASLWFRSNDRFVRYYPELENGVTVTRQRIVNGYSNMDASLGKKIWKNRIHIQAGMRNLLNVQSAVVTGGAGAAHNSESAQPVSPGRSVWVRAAINI